MSNLSNNNQSFSSDTAVVISIPYPSKDGNRGGFVSENITVADLNLSEAVDAPAFPSQKLMEIQSSPLADDDKAAAISKLMQDYSAAQQSYTSLGNVSQIDMVPQAVVDYLIANKGFVKSADQDGPYIEASQLMATYNNGLLHITGTAVWG